MGLRFRKRIRIAKGISLNLGKNGVSTSLGVKGLTVNSSGRVTTSIPGSGISYSTNLNSKQHASIKGQKMTNQIENKERNTINEDQINFNSFDELMDYYIGSKVDISLFEKEKVSKFLIVLSIIVLIVCSISFKFQAETIFVWLVIIMVGFGIAKYKKDSAYKELISRATTHNNNVEFGRERMLEKLKRFESELSFEKAIMIVAKHIWIGEPVDYVVESLGKPSKIDEKTLKDKVKQTYFYNPINARSYAVKVYFENGEVVGWDK